MMDAKELRVWLSGILVVLLTLALDINEGRENYMMALACYVASLVLFGANGVKLIMEKP